jgi:hypothetical protein
MREVAMRVLTATTRGLRHAAGAVAEGVLVMAIVGALAIAVGFTGGQPAGADAVSAAQKVKATMVASPTVVSVGQTLALQGAGLDPTRQTWVKTVTASATGWVNVAVAADGSYAVDLSFPSAGSASISLYQLVNNRSLLMSSCTVTVQ